MPADSGDALDIRDLLQRLRGERYRAFLLHDAPLRGKSAFARKLTETAGGAYVDVLGVVASTPELCDRVDTLGPDLLTQLALGAAAKGHPLVVVDEFDFLVPVWGGDVGSVLEIVRKLSVTETEAVVGFVMQTVPSVEQARISTASGESRILTMEGVKPL